MLDGRRAGHPIARFVNMCAATRRQQWLLTLGAAAAIIGATLTAGPRVPALYEGVAGAQAVPTVVVTGVAPNHSSVKVFFQPVAGAKDYRIYDITAPKNVKYAGLMHL